MAGVALWNGSILSEQRNVCFLIGLFKEMAVELEEPISMNNEELEEENLLLAHVLEGVATAEEEAMAP